MVRSSLRRFSQSVELIMAMRLTLRYLGVELKGSTNLITGRSVTGVLHFVNQTPVHWFTKKQPTVETATYGSEFIAAKLAVEQIMVMRLTL